MIKNNKTDGEGPQEPVRTQRVQRSLPTGRLPIALAGAQAGVKIAEFHAKALRRNAAKYSALFSALL